MANIDPKFWGAGLWKTMYSVAESLPNDSKSVSDTQIESIKLFFKVLGDVIPCETCRDNYKEDCIKIQFPKILITKL